MKLQEVTRIRSRAAGILRRARIVVTDVERKTMEVADCGLGDIDRLGLQVIVYENNNRYCAKELIILPGQMFPEHRHPDIDGRPGKRETFRCRWGQVFLYVEGDPTPRPRSSVPKEFRPFLTVWHEVVLGPGDQYTLDPGIRHWFQAGGKGAVVSEFSSPSFDEGDIFTDPRVRRVPVIDG